MRGDYQQPTRLYKQLGEALRNARLLQTLSLDDAAKLTGVSKGNLSYYENGKRCLSLRTFERILDGYDMKAQIQIVEDLS